MGKYVAIALSVTAVGGLLLADSSRASDEAIPARDAAAPVLAPAPPAEARLADGVLLDLDRGGVLFAGARVGDSAYLVLVPATIRLGDQDVTARAADLFDDPWSLGDPPAMGAGASHVCALEDGVTWETADGGCKDLLTGLVWSTGNMSVDEGGSGWYWSSAKQHIENSNEGGYGDWRMPTKAEVETVAAHGAATHWAEGSAGSYRWTSTKKGQKRWIVRPANGNASLQWAGGPAESAFAFIGVREAPGGGGGPECGNGICEPGEDCNSCSGDCDGRRSGPPSQRHCCGNGVTEGPENDGRCDGND